MVARHAARVVVEKLPTARSSNYICRHCRQHQLSNSSASQTRSFVSSPARNDFEPERPLTTLEKVRKSLWKGEAPGPKNIDDVYGGKGALAGMREARANRRSRKSGKNEEVPQQSTVNAGPIYDESFEVSEAITVSKPSGTSKARETAEEWEEVDDESTNIPEFVRPLVRAQMPANEVSQDGIENWEGLEVIGHRGHWQDMPVSDSDEYEPWMHAKKAPGFTYAELVPMLEECMIQQLPTELKAGKKIDCLSQEVNLRKPETFQILKQLSQLTSFRIPDPVLNRFRHDTSTKTYRDLLIILAEEMRPQPATVTEKLAADFKLSSIANLQIASRRETSIDKDKEVGRWKLIEQELQARGLEAQPSRTFKYWAADKKRPVVKTDDEDFALLQG